jgi:Sulfotransferase domain
MTGGHEGHAGSTLIRKLRQNWLILKLRQNWRWSKSHSWAHLIEEHDLNPLVRGQRAIRKMRWRLMHRDRKECAAPVFLVGVGRSGTNLLAHSLDEMPEFQVYNEGNTRAFDNFRIRPLPDIEPLIRQSRAKFVLFKPLCESHRTPELLDYFGQQARAIWAYRNVDGRVRSTVAKFGDSNLRVLRAYAAGEEPEPWSTWQVQGLSAENSDFIRSFDFSRLSAESAAALFWYVRNSLYFEMALDQRPDTMLVNYDDLLAEPERVALGLCSFLNLPYRREMIANIDRRRPTQRPPLAIDHRIRERCSELKERLDAACLGQISRLTGERFAVPPTPPLSSAVMAHP